MLKWFVASNARLSLIIHRRLPWRFRRDFFRLYYELVADKIRSQRPRYVLDVGCGRRTYIANLVPNKSTLLVGLDYDFQEIRHNIDLTNLVVSDAARALPFENDSIDLLTTRSVLEHLSDVDQFFNESHRVLSPGGYIIHIMPGRMAPFAMLNRLFPNRFTKRVLRLLYPETESQLGFRAYYKECSYRGIEELLERSGFEVEKINCRYYQSTYFRAFFPAYVLFLVYDLMLWLLQAKNLSSQIIVIARKMSTLPASS